MVSTPTYIHQKDWPIDFKEKANIILHLLNNAAVEGYWDGLYTAMRNHCTRNFVSALSATEPSSRIPYTSIKANNVFLVGSAFNEKALVEYTFEIQKLDKVETVNQTWIYVKYLDMKVKNPNLQRKPDPFGFPWLLQRIISE